MSSSPKVSVIVAIFNAERTLRRCLDSLAAQTLDGIEFVLIDDGSSDSSWSICQEYQSRDPRFKIYHQENKGVSRTRQTGLFLSAGKYIIYLDSDDYALPDAYRSLYIKAMETEADIIYAGYLQKLSTVTLQVTPVIPNCTMKRMLADTIYHNRGFLWNHLIRREIIDDYSVTFPTIMDFGEDQYFIINLLSKALRSHRNIETAFLDQPIICYDKTANPHSLTNLVARKRSESKYFWWKEVGKLINGVNAELPYYSVLVADAFYAFWNRIFAHEEFINHYRPYSKPIWKYAAFSSRKIIVLLAANGYYDLARHLRWICAPSILYERVLQRRNKNSQRLK